MVHITDTRSQKVFSCTSVHKIWLFISGETVASSWHAWGNRVSPSPVVLTGYPGTPVMPSEKLGRCQKECHSVFF